jgi:hypothetical protein
MCLGPSAVAVMKGRLYVTKTRWFRERKIGFCNNGAFVTMVKNSTVKTKRNTEMVALQAE